MAMNLFVYIVHMNYERFHFLKSKTQYEKVRCVGVSLEANRVCHCKPNVILGRKNPVASPLNMPGHKVIN